ncbi:flagellar basal body rod protein FlgB [Pelotomaculum propionicicum]|uniref:Flagellar basal body rod protein FlgB n=1 Tax=Pelotomaculum propionicicum TaxID=258475 RepID=A0A4Y7RR51_9FIRM|nr:flagellar basal body rod protein FlgB [Pelotomaculum propionicicum]TEB11162.1 Flagellar basal body rod protein FlgB [Pelotomaculum propionicicum]
MDLLSSPVIVSLEKALDAGALRQRVIADNIANINTPNFKKSTVEFESLLKAALGRDSIKLTTTDPRHFGAAPLLAELRPEVRVNEATSMRTDGNNVDIDEEMTNLAANSIEYQATARELSERLSLLGYVITGGKG